MFVFEPGDIVRKNGRGHEMLVISRTDDEHHQSTSPAYDCVWEQGQLLREEVISGSDLILVRRERRRVLRGGVLPIPTDSDSERKTSVETAIDRNRLQSK